MELSVVESSPLSQSSEKNSRNGGRKRGQIWANFTEETDATGHIAVRCRECKQVFAHPFVNMTNRKVSLLAV